MHLIWKLLDSSMEHQVGTTVRGQWPPITTKEGSTLCASYESEKRLWLRSRSSVQVGPTWTEECYFVNVSWVLLLQMYLFLIATLRRHVKCVV